MIRYRDLIFFGLLIAASWFVVIVLILGIAAIVHLVGWLGFVLGVGAFVALAAVIGSILVENADDLNDDLYVPDDWAHRGEL